MSYSKVCIIVPAFNEEETIKQTILNIKKLDKKLEVIVVNDGSFDTTVQEVQRTGCKIINLPFNLGVGPAVQTGLLYAKKNGFNTAIQLDADGQHSPTDIPRLLKATEQANLVIGSRFIKPTGYDAPFPRLLLRRVLSILIYFLSKRKIYDPTSGYRVYDRKIINFLTSNSLNETSDLLWLPILLKNGYKIKEVSVKMNKRLAGTSSFKTWQSLYLVVAVSISMMIESIKSKNGK